TGNTPLFPDQVTVADVSGAGGVSSYDAALIARYAAGLPSPTGLAGTWIFLPSSIDHAGVTSNFTDDFQGLLMGEVSGNWAPPGMRPANVERSAGTAAVELP